jgi:hypothetical protein
MRPPLILMAHFHPAELSLCPDCGRVSNDPLACNACGNTLGLTTLAHWLNRHSLASCELDAQDEGDQAAEDVRDAVAASERATGLKPPFCI